jgi:hypothetical protein
MKRVCISFILLAAAASAPAWAQLPQVILQEPPNVAGTVEHLPVTGEVVNQVRDIRRAQVGDLLRLNRRELEADPAGQPIVRSQIIAVGMSQAAIAAAEAGGFQLVRTDAIDDVNSMVTLQAPASMSTRQALRRLREADPNGVYDFDHLYLESGARAAISSAGQVVQSRAGPRIGLIDSGVGASLRVAAQRSFAGAAPVAAPHGDRIAGLLVRAAPGAQIYAADIYGGVPTGGASSALARALGWLAQENVQVINVSLVGPRNRIVEAIVARMVARGFLVVAAVGNDGPAAAPLYPASYDGVIGVTGVDARQRVLIEAGRGAQVDFAALGVYGAIRGTSYAAPVIAARLAQEAPVLNSAGAHSAVNALRASARDLGAAGRDDIYGYGLIASD